MTKPFSKLTFTLVMLCAAAARADGHTATADTENVLPSVQVTGNRIDGVAATQKKRDQIQKELIGDSRDLVRYTTDVGISDAGRHNKGFAMRGVEGNRVGISIDGVSLPDSEENSLYARYGNFNNSRLSIDPELVRSIDIERGANSFHAGSGALGGGVNYRTLNAADIILPGRRFGGYLKSGYTSKNNEWVHTTGVAFHHNRFDALALYSRRRGHELESSGKGEDINGDARGVPDPSQHLYHSYLLKLGLNLHEQHRIGYAFNAQKGSNITDERSYILLPSWWREADDQHRRLNHNLFYEWTPESPYLSLLKIDIDKQDTGIASVNNKGGRNWQSEAKELWEVFDRRMKTDFKRITLRMDSQALTFAGGEHRFTLKTYLSEKKFENINQDTYYLSSGPSTVINTIQHPVKTHAFGISLLDNITWHPRFSGRIGLRYDADNVKPQALNVQCNNCEKTVPAANRFSGVSGVLGLDARLNDNWQLNYDLSSGFRIPSSSEMYFTYRHPAGNWLANPKLKAERSLNHAIALRGDGRLGYLGLTFYHNRYRNFLMEQETTGSDCDPYGCRETLFQQMVNIDTAIINGIDLQGELNLHTVSRLPEGWKLSGGLGYSHGKLSSGTGLLSIQPLKLLFGIGYDQADGRWGIHTRVTYLGRKKSQDAMTVNHRWSWATRSYTRTEEPYPYLNKAATVFDLYGYARLGKRLTLRAGIYNIFNRRYQTWDALRGINRHSTTNTVDREGKGLARFYAPGRNAALSLEVQF